MIHYITGLGQVWVGSRPPLNQAFNILWLKPAETKESWELRIFNQSRNSWDLISTAKADQELLARVEALEEEQGALSLKITNIEGNISALEEDTLKLEDILQEEGNNLDKVISQDAITKILQQLRSNIPDLNAHNTSPSSHEDIRTLVENNAQKINTNTANIEKSVVLPTFNSAENSLTFNTQGGDNLKVELGTGGAGIQTFTITDFKNVKSPELYKLPAGTLFKVQVDNSTVQNGPFSGKGDSSGIGYILSNILPGKDSTALIINWILQSNQYDGLYLGNTVTLTTSVVSTTWTNSQTNDVVTISDFKNTSWTNHRKAGDFVFIKSSDQGIPNGPTDSSAQDFYIGYAQIIRLAEDGNKLIKFFIQSYSDEIFSGTLVETGGEAVLEWREIDPKSSNNFEGKVIEVYNNLTGLPVDFSPVTITLATPLHISNKGTILNIVGSLDNSYGGDEQILAPNNLNISCVITPSSTNKILYPYDVRVIDFSKLQDLIGYTYLARLNLTIGDADSQIKTSKMKLAISGSATEISMRINSISYVYKD